MRIATYEDRLEADATCEYGHYGCSIDGEDGGPCLNEWFYLVEEFDNQSEIGG